jgi:TonB family protein
MIHYRGLAVWLINLSVLTAVVVPAVAQHEVNGDEVSLASLYSPTYPSIARTARVSGDVKIRVEVRKGGAVSSVQVISGPALLKQSALDSAQKSTFDCEHCEKEITRVIVTYTFVLREFDCSYKRVRSAKCAYVWKCGGWRPNSISRPQDVHEAGDHVTISADAPCVQVTDANLAKN